LAEKGLDLSWKEGGNLKSLEAPFPGVIKEGKGNFMGGRAISEQRRMYAYEIVTL